MKDFCRSCQFSFISLAAHSEFFFAKVKRFSEFYFTAKFWSFKLKKQFRMAEGDKNFQPPFFCKKMANEDASLLFTLLCNLPQSGNRKSSSLKKQSFFFTSSPNSRSLACEDAPVFISLRRGKPFHSACEEVSLRCPWSFLPSSFAKAAEDKPGVRMVFLIKAHLRCLHGGKPPWILLLLCYINETFEMVRNSVEAELHGKSPLQYWCKIPCDVFFCNRQPILDNIKVAWYSKPIACTLNIIQGGINILWTITKPPNNALFAAKR